jgi:hypothetical protein
MSSFDVQVQVEEIYQAAYGDWLEYQQFVESEEQAEIDELNKMLAEVVLTEAELDAMAQYYGEA